MTRIEVRGTKIYKEMEYERARRHREEPTSL